MTDSGSALWQRTLGELPLIAILRGVTPAEVVTVAEALSSAGFLCVEVPLNSPDALVSIRKLRERFAARMLIGAGTVLAEADVDAVQQAGAQMVVSPNTNPGVIAAARRLGLISIPGFVTPTEAFAGIAAGASGLKLFPAEATSPPVLRALKAVLPRALPILVVGGITATNMAAFTAAGATGFGIGSSLYTPGSRAQVVADRAAAFVNAWTVSRTRATPDP